jgi:hypothetical protein
MKLSKSNYWAFALLHFCTFALIRRTYRTEHRPVRLSFGTPRSISFLNGRTQTSIWSYSIASTMLLHAFFGKGGGA